MSNVVIKNSVEKRLDALYTNEDGAYQRIILSDDPQFEYYVHYKIMAKLQPFLKQDSTENYFTSKQFYQPYSPLNKKDKEKGYLLFSIMYPYYLAKHGFLLQDCKKLMIGPMIIKNKNQQIELDSNYTQTTMMSFAIQTGIKPKTKNQNGGENTTTKISLELPIDRQKIKSLLNGDDDNSKVNEEVQIENENANANDTQSTPSEVDLKIARLQSNVERVNQQITQLQYEKNQQDEQNDEPVELTATIACEHNKDDLQGLYKIFSFPSFASWKKNTRYWELVKGFLKVNDDTRISIIDGKWKPERPSVYEVLKPYFRGSEKRQKNPLHFYRYFGIEKRNRINELLKIFRKKMSGGKGSFFDRIAGSHQKKQRKTKKIIRFSVKKKTKKRNTFDKVIKRKRFTNRKNTSNNKWLKSRKHI
jgi:hypothetical protein